VSDAGFVNAHTHIYSGLAPLGMPAPAAAPENFVQILERVWWRLDRALDERSLRAAARYYVADALLHGTVALVDHHESPTFIEGSLDVLADACQDLGLRAVVCFGATERNGGRSEAQRGLAECRRFIRGNDRSLVRGTVGLHASFTVSDETIREAGELCRELGTVLHVHVAEDLADVRDAQDRGWKGPFERLRTLGALPPGSILAHGVHLDGEAVRAAAAAGCWIVQNPRSNRGNRVGYPGALAASTRVALGTDGYPSDERAEVAVLREEARRHGEEERVVGRRVAAGHEIIAERFAPAVGLGVDTCERSTGGVRLLRIAGRVTVQDGILQTGDLVAIRAEAEAAAPLLWNRMEAL
jgi:cytosine/adenosine deaminase-related metal-dependent hydrolase